MKAATQAADQVRLAILHPTLGTLAVGSAKFSRKEANKLLGESRPGLLTVTIPEDMPRPAAKRKPRP